MTKTLVIVGAGPKAAAIVARAAVLRDLGRAHTLPTIRVYDRKGPGAAWDGEAGFTSGLLTLCSPAEKDVGFPYLESLMKAKDLKAPIGREIQRRFSWSAFLVATGRFAEWVDRGREPPPHSTWSAYIKWVFAEAGHAVIIADVTRIVQTARGTWRLTHEAAGRVAETDEADGVVLTGAGEANRVAKVGDIPDGRIFDAADVWDARDRLLADREQVVAIVGAGGAAGAVAAWLAPRLEERGSSIRSISSMGTLLPRGDGYGERRWFSDPSDWRDLSEAHRRTLLDHTEAGVISARNKAVIDASPKILYVVGRAASVSADGFGELTVQVTYEHKDPPKGAKRTFDVQADFLINAMGFDPWTLLNIVPGKAHALLGESDAAKALRAVAEREMLEDLSLPPSSGVAAGLHVPALAGFARGPGMPTLGSLGLVAKLVLDCYTS